MRRTIRIYGTIRACPYSRYPINLLPIQDRNGPSEGIGQHLDRQVTKLSSPETLSRRRAANRFAACYGPEFAGRLLDQWAYLNKVELDFSRPGKPMENA